MSTVSIILALCSVLLALYSYSQIRVAEETVKNLAIQLYYCRHNLKIEDVSQSAIK
jgi:hypothetical protein